MSITAALSLSPAAPAPGAVLTARYAVSGVTPGTSWSLAFSGTVTVNGTAYDGASGSLTLPGAPAVPVTYQVPSCPGLTFAAAKDPAVFTATVPAGGTVSGVQTVKGSVAVGSGAPIAVSASVTLPSAPAPAPSSQCYFGVWDPASVSWTGPGGDPVGEWAGAAKFSAAPVKSLTYYSAWLQPFMASLNTVAAQHGATLYLNLEPWNTWGGGANPTVPDIAAGKYDSWLTSIGIAVKAGGRPVWLTFAHEMNGNGWYPWQQSGGVTPAQWIAAWTHVYQTVKAAAGDLAVFVWAPNNADVGPVSPYWPGDALVGIAGWDGYLQTAGQTYSNFLAPTVKEIRSLTSKPVWLAETGVTPADGTRAARITGLVSDLKADGVTGLAYFNEGSDALTTAEISALTAAVNSWNAS